MTGFDKAKDKLLRWTMAKRNIAIYLLIGCFILAVIIYYLEIIPAVLQKIPQNVYSAYLAEKLSSDCRICINNADLCTDTNGNTVYIVRHWETQSWGKELFFDGNGTLLCTANPTFGSCKGGCPSLYAGCPDVRSCSSRVLG